MKSELRHSIAVGLLALALTPAGWAENVFQPGVQHVCVPNTDRNGWDCGTAEDPPPGYRKPMAETDRPAKSDTDVRAQSSSDRSVSAAPVVETNAMSEPASSPHISPPPPPFLANPNRPRFPMPGMQPSRAFNRPAVVQAPAEPPPATATEPPAGVEPAPPEPDTALTATAASPTIEPPVVAPESPPPAAAEVPAAEPIAAAISPTPTATPPAPAASLTTAPDADVRASAAVAATPPSTPPPTLGLQSASARALLAALPGARAFAQLRADHYTLQLAGAASASAFPELIEHLAIDPQRCYVLRVNRDGGDWWLLVLGDFADLATARAAARDLPRDPALAAVWPRRVGFLQAEFVPGSNR